MKTLINSTDFSDCTSQDFGHYFGGTVMIWTLPNTKTKRRAFVVGDVEKDNLGRLVIGGQYLTKLREWKQKRILFDSWSRQLAPVSIRDMFFRCGDGVMLYSPALGRTSGALRKSIQWGYKNMQQFGKIAPADLTSQGITWWAFNDLYDHDRERIRTLPEILTESNDRSAEVDHEGFIVTRTGSPNYSLQYRQKKIGAYNPTTKLFTPVASAKSWAEYLRVVKGLAHHGITVKGAGIN